MTKFTIILLVITTIFTFFISSIVMFAFNLWSAMLVNATLPCLIIWVGMHIEDYFTEPSQFIPMWEEL